MAARLYWFFIFRVSASLATAIAFYFRRRTGSLNASLAKVGDGQRPVADDRPAGKMRILRSFFAGSVLYVALSVFEMFVNADPQFLDLGDFLRAEFCFVVVMTALVAALWVAWFRRTSRGHLLFSRYLAVLVFLVPAIWFFVFADADRYLDRRTPVIVDRLVTKHYAVEKKSGKTSGGSVICFEPAALAGRSGEGATLDLPTCQRFTDYTYASLQPGQGVRFHIGRGALGIAWYKRIQPLEM